MADQSDLLARGRQVTATLWGDLMKTAPTLPAAALAPDFFALVTQFVFGMFWSRPNLDLRSRSLCTVAQLAALGKTDELKGHLVGALNLGISRDEARRFIDTYFERFAGVRAYLDEQVEKARELGYVETLLGRRRYVPELRSRNWNVRQFGERVAQNTPIQGTAADMIKRAMIDVQRALDERGGDARLLLQVHDELLLEVPEGELDEVRTLVVGRMEGAMELKVPLVAESGMGANWYECKG